MVLIRRRSVSSLVSPGPRPPMPPPCDADPAADLPGQVAAPAAQPLGQVLQLGQLDLRLALGRLGVLGEDVEDQRGPVDHLDLDPVLQVAQLAGRQLAVADHGVGAAAAAPPRAASSTLPLPTYVAGSGRCRRCSSASSTCDPAVSASSLSSASEFSASVGLAPGPHADQHHPLEPQLAVLDLARCPRARWTGWPPGAATGGPRDPAAPAGPAPARARRARTALARARREGSRHTRSLNASVGRCRRFDGRTPRCRTSDRDLTRVWPPVQRQRAAGDDLGRAR